MQFQFSASGFHVLFTSVLNSPTSPTCSSASPQSLWYRFRFLHGLLHLQIIWSHFTKLLFYLVLNVVLEVRELFRGIMALAMASWMVSWMKAVETIPTKPFPTTCVSFFPSSRTYWGHVHLPQHWYIPQNVVTVWDCRSDEVPTQSVDVVLLVQSDLC